MNFFLKIFPFGKVFILSLLHYDVTSLFTCKVLQVNNSRLPVGMRVSGMRHIWQKCLFIMVLCLYDISTVWIS